MSVGYECHSLSRRDSCGLRKSITNQWWCPLKMLIIGSRDPLFILHYLVLVPDTINTTIVSDILLSARTRGERAVYHRVH